MMIYAIIHRGKEFENVAHRRLGPRERAGGSIFNGRPTAGKVEDGDRPQRAFFLLRRLATLRRRLLIHSQWEMAICQAMVIDMCAARQQDVLAINSKKGIRPMPDTPPFGRYAEIPYDHMTPEQQEGYRSLIETHGQVGGPSKDLGCTTQASEGGRTARRAFSPRRGTRYRSASARSPSASSTINGIRPIRPTRMSGAARKSDRRRTRSRR